MDVANAATRVSENQSGEIAQDVEVDEDDMPLSQEPQAETNDWKRRMKELQEHSKEHGQKSNYQYDPIIRGFFNWCSEEEDRNPCCAVAGANYFRVVWELYEKGFYANGSPKKKKGMSQSNLEKYARANQRSLEKARAFQAENGYDDLKAVKSKDPLRSVSMV